MVRRELRRLCSSLARRRSKLVLRFRRGVLCGKALKLVKPVLALIAVCDIVNVKRTPVTVRAYRAASREQKRHNKRNRCKKSFLNTHPANMFLPKFLHAKKLRR